MIIVNLYMIFFLLILVGRTTDTSATTRIHHHLMELLVQAEGSRYGNPR
ncbi:MAG: hypothetical protein IJ604_06295 [Prevotella sp.]|nr:hypothetical protein [Prevotella sp.]MBR1462975.1 hypothetical protein [Prevotella sp.]